MRITGGKYVRRQIQCPPGVIRPAMDRMRESLFAILGDLSGLSFLDLFSGSGCVAIEAASRGADPVHLVENDRGKKATIEKNLSFVEESHRLFMMDADRFILSSPYRYSIVYADPPFPMAGKLELLNKADKSGIVKEGGLFIIHYPEEEEKEWPESVNAFTLVDKRKYGRSMLRFYRREIDVQDR
ncbi:MAG: 16S rRNA (guanine(966)-N(2))-methyltransferase RsmD [Candidatus Ornithospirochaeta sp.]|nr:16S rRNA (guanine(966)-N(2))-methyltransferase RsmD [Candidatus Ornithospirochaeta sp.]